MERVEADLFMADGRVNPIVDVRSPAEYKKGHIPGAVNIPIFDDLERAKVGTAYKQQSRDEAITLGLEIVGPKMQSAILLINHSSLYEFYDFVASTLCI